VEASAAVWEAVSAAVSAAGSAAMSAAVLEAVAEVACTHCLLRSNNNPFWLDSKKGPT